MYSLLDKYWWVPRTEAVYQPHFRSGLVHDIYGEETAVFCKVKENKIATERERGRERGRGERGGGREREKERNRYENPINFKCMLPCS